MNVFTGAIATEINSFAPLPTTLNDFKALYYFPAGTHPDESTIFTAPTYEARRFAEELGWNLSEGLCAGAQPSGVVTRDCYEKLRDELLNDLLHAGPQDMVLLMLHGAMIADGYDDCEGDILKRVREIVGETCKIGVLLDPHANLSSDMLYYSDIMVFFKEYPHTDVKERAREMIQYTIDAANGLTKPIYSVFDCEQIDLYHTTKEPMISIVEKMTLFEARQEIISVSLIHGFPWADVEDMGTKVLVVSNNARPKGDQYAAEIGQQIKNLRGQTGSDGVSLDDALNTINRSAVNPIVLSDGSDNPGGGAPGDSTYVYHGLIAAQIDNFALAAFCDPVATNIALSFGVGAKIPLRIGGKVCALSGSPIDIEVEITAIKMGAVQDFGGSDWPAGDLVRVTAGNIDLVLSNQRTQVFSPSIFTDLGICINSKKVLVVKSSQHFYAGFNLIAKDIIYAQALGTNILDFTQLPFKKIKFPKWPWPNLQ